MWAMLIPLISSILGENGPLGQYFKTKAETVKATADYNLQVEKAKLDYAAQMAKSATEQQANQLASVTSSVRAWILTLINLPIVITCVSPSTGKDIFASISIVPQWYAMLDVAIIGTVFGLPIAVNWMSSVFSGIQDAWLNRQDKKIEKIQVLGEAQQIGKDAAKKEIFDTMKKAVNLNGYTQSQVDILNPVLDKILAAQVVQQAPPVSTTTINN